MINSEKQHDAPDKLKLSKFVILALVGIAIVIFAANYVGKETAILAGNLLYVPVTIAMVVSAVILLKKSSTSGERKQIVFVVLAFTSWLVAEHIWLVTELILHEKPFPSLADYFYVLGYVFLFTFLIQTVWKSRSSLSANNKLIITLATIAFIIPSVLVAYHQNNNSDPSSLYLALAYPFLDGLILWPGLAGLFVLPIKKKGNPWLWGSIAVMLLLIGDTLFLIYNNENNYYTGYPFEIFFYYAYVMFAYTTYKASKLAEQGIGALITRHDVLTANKSTTRVIATLVTIAAIIIAATLSMIGIFGFSNLTTRETQVIIPSIIVGMGLIAVSVAVKGYVTMKMVSTKSQIYGMEEQNVSSYVCTENDIQAQVMQLQNKIAKLEKNRRDFIPLLMVGTVMVAIILTYYVMVNTMEFTEQEKLSHSRFLIENLKGSTINTWISWGLVSGEHLHVTIVNSDILPKDKLDSIKNAILSEESIQIRNSQVGKNSSDSVSTYYKGWTGALEKASQSHTNIFIPVRFDIAESDKSVGDIVIILSTQKDADGALAFTRTIADENEHQILKSFITIFGVTDLTNNELSAVTRHEFGHALGMIHSSDTVDLMSPQFDRRNAYISDCDIGTIVSLYNGTQSNQFTCQN